MPQPIIPWSEARADAKRRMDSATHCDLCELDKTCRTSNIEPDDAGVGPEDAADVLIVGEAPGADEDSQGIPFVGRSGQLLREIVKEVGLANYGVVYTNVVRCRPPANATPSKKEIGYCLGLLQEEIVEYDPEVVVLLGNVPLNAILGESGITNWRGVVVERDGRIYVPTFHPAYILRNVGALPEIIADFEKVVDVLEGNITPPADADYRMELVVTRQQANEMAEAIRQAGECSFDTEITSLRPFDLNQDIVMCSFAVDEPNKRAWAVSPNQYVQPIVKGLLVDDAVEKIGHNIKFDALAALGIWDIWVESITGDTMLLSYILDSRPGRHGLKVLAGRYLGMYDYDRKLKQVHSWSKDADPAKGGDLGLVPQDVLADYAAKDAIATLELERRLRPELTAKQQVLYEQLLMPASATLTQMEANGVRIDCDVCADYIDLYEAEQTRQLNHMHRDLVFQRWLRMRRAKPTKTKVTKKGKLKVKEVDSDFEFNPNSTVQVREILFGGRYFGLEPIGYTDTGLPSTKWDYIKVFAKDVPWVEHLRYFKLLSKMLGTYLRPALERWPNTGDRRVRATYHLHGTVTGRLASRQPNLQNIPTPEKEPDTILAVYPVKDIFTHTHPDGCLLAVDYAGMELRVMASLSNCVGMLQAFKDGEDIHSVVTCALNQIDYDEFMDALKGDNADQASWAEALRYKAKWVNWTLLYGGGAGTLHRLYGLDKLEAEALIQFYYNAYPEVLTFQQRAKSFARETGYVESPFGRRRYLPYINDPDDHMRARAEREAINMETQSAASDILLCALVVLDDLLLQYGYRSMMVNTVHDSAMFDIWPGELGEVSRLCKDVMENIPSRWGPQYFPGLDFSWFISPLVADFEVGSHYGSLSHLEVSDG